MSIWLIMLITVVLVLVFMGVDGDTDGAGDR